jgi:hypothetical protein
MPLWYVPRTAGLVSEPQADPRDAHAGTEEPAASPDDVQLWAWTYAASQKVRNLQRDPRATLQVEAGELYHELRGVMLECEVVVHRELDVVSALGHEILTRNAAPRGEPPAQLPEDARAAIAKQAAKRVGLQFVESRRATWDHRKLGGIY